MRPKASVVLLFFMVLSALAIVLTLNTGASGYEISIYLSTSPFAWMIFVGGLLVGIGISLYSLLIRPREDMFWTGFIMVLITKLSLVLLPVLRGYYANAGADPLAHIGMVKDVVDSGHIGENNIYPYLHLLTAIISTVTHIPVVDTANLMPGLMLVARTMALYLLAIAVFRNRKLALLVLVASAPFLLGTFEVAIYPHSLANTFLPLIIYACVKISARKTFSYHLLSVTLILILPFLHPVVAGSILAGLLSIEIAKILVPTWARTLTGKSLWSKHHALRQFSIYPCLLIITTLYSWISQFLLFDTKVRTVYSNLVSPKPPPHLGTAIEVIQLNEFDMMQYLARAWTDNFVYLAVTLIVILMVIKATRGSRPAGRNHLLLLSIIVLSSGIYELVFFLLVHAQYPVRTAELNVATVLSPIFVAYAIHATFINKIRWKKAVGTSLYLFLVIVTMISVFSLYASPYTYQMSHHVTRADVEGTRWLVTYKDRAILYGGLGMIHSFVNPVLGYEPTFDRRDVYESSWLLTQLERLAVPSHLGYRVHTGGGFGAHPPHKFFGEHYTNKIYIVMTNRFIEGNLEPTLQKGRIYSLELGRWDISLDEVYRFWNDPSVDKLHSNGLFDVYLVKPLSRVEEE